MNGLFVRPLGPFKRIDLPQLFLAEALFCQSQMKKFDSSSFLSMHLKVLRYFTSCSPFKTAQRER